MHCIESDDEEQAVQAKVEVGAAWEAVGPFLSGMREHPYLASPLHAFAQPGSDADVDFATRPYNDDTWPSELSDGGRVGWKRFRRDDDGWINVSYPEVRWKQLRADHGWASLQYQTLLRGKLTIPLTPNRDTTLLKIDVIQAVEYAFIPLGRTPSSPVLWYNADIYNFAETPSGSADSGSTSNFARSVELEAGEYIMLIRAIYEIRLFGDPGEAPPAIRLKINAEVGREGPRLLKGLAVVPDVVDGLLVGDWMSVALSAGRHDVFIEDISGGADGVSLESIQSTTLVSGQTRSLPIHIRQTAPLARSISTLHVKITLRVHGEHTSLIWRPTIRHFSMANRHPFRCSFASPDLTAERPALVSRAMVIPPGTSPKYSDLEKVPVILALHGAGVDVEWDTWTSAMPKTGGWVIMPTGKTEWGEDWHGASMADAWAARDSLSGIAAKLGLTVPEDTLLIGHSNGGQGAWHLASRYPDRVVGVIAAAGYSKIQDYVSYSESVSRHYADPALMGILQSSLTTYDNDLYLSNLVNIPILALHGGDDSNVPPRHSRLQAALVDAWQGDPHAVKVVEVQGKDHWWDGMMEHPEVVDFIRKAARQEKRNWAKEREQGFTLTCANPDECGGRAGIRITELLDPGRLARLDVNARQWRKPGEPSEGLDLRGMNIRRIEVRGTNGEWAETELVETPNETDASSPEPYIPRAYGPMMRILASSGPILIVVGSSLRHRNLAKRIAHDVLTYHRTDCEIVHAEEALRRLGADDMDGNIVVIGRPEENTFAEKLLAAQRIPLTFPQKGGLTIGGSIIDEADSGVITLHPHPTRPKGLALLIAGNDARGLETAARLFPIRTGVTVPDWAVVGPRMSWQGANGLIGAGFWGASWAYNPVMSWIDRPVQTSVQVPVALW